MDEARSQTSEAYEMVSHEDAASPSPQAAVARADDVYRAFFQDDDEDEAQEEDDEEGTRRHAFFDEILAACVADKKERARLYPSKANRRLLLSTIYGSAALDRIQSDALVLYLVMRRGLAPARRFARAARLPSHVFSLIRAYWHLDGGRYLAAVPLLPRELDPAQAEKILAVLNPLDGAPSPEEETEKALAMDRFLALCVPSSLSSSSSLLLLDEQLAPARIVSLCHARGIVEAWNTVLRNDTQQQTSATRAACIVALVRFCLVPVARRAAVDALVAMCLSPREDAELADALLASAPALSKGNGQEAPLPEAARATALDLVVVRRITAGRYVDALRLLARIAAASTVVTDSKLRHKRQALVAAAKAALTHVERSLLAIEGAAAAHTLGDGDEDTGARDGGSGGGDNDVHMAMSWEAVHQNGNGDRGNESSAVQPLTASPAVRASPLRQGGRGAAEAQSALLAAVLRASPRSQSRSQSQSQSPTPPRPVRTSASTAAASASPLRAKSRLAFRASPSSSPSSSSPAAAVASPALRTGQRPYSLDDKSASTGNKSGMVTARESSSFTENSNDGAYIGHGASQQAGAAEAQAEIDGEAEAAAAETGPYARLARQLQAHFSAAAGSSGPPSPSDVLQPLLRRRGARESSSQSLAAMDVDGGADSNRQGEEPARDKASLMQRPARRYEATYKIDSSGRRRQAEKDDDGEHDDGKQEQETPAKARNTRRTRAAGARKGAGNKKKEQSEGEQAEEEEGQDQLMELAEPPRKPATTRRGSPTKKKTTKNAATKEPAVAAPRRSTRLSSAEPAARTPLTASATLPEMRELSSATATATATSTRAKARSTRTRSASPSKRAPAQEQGADDDDNNEEEEEEVPRRRTRTRSSRMDMPGAF
ncbi:hypothetical protein FA10DRAFT_304863 [Acaromyces ingoldii]|uniref:ELYS-like domain-containing protein n=1 Tax=Acaromyces ingoldii TaxID=215250 RepID=A0A316YFM2_9BASI|nr:hypothetical protein FA10DRAFT_304863 [Acaromyces ingoldii]PWN86545.1 hypothetical protein FA10DRAFT_304863 [Acaromyces ingoldii]